MKYYSSRSAPLLLCCLLAVTSLSQAAELAVVSTEAGSYQGHGSPFAEGVSSFKGIAYAAPPVGERRWKPPALAPGFSGTKMADEIGPACWQARNSDQTLYYRGNLERSEDCLYLNVFTAAQEPGESLPVMVWFHGGGNTAGHGGAQIFDGSNLAARGAVVVTANYRLGALGFLAHPALTAESEHDASGNYGILDQIQALRWVQENIAQFGGDPQRVTIFGQSAGGTDVCLIMSSPLTEGLVHRVIGQSPGCIKSDVRLKDGPNSGHDSGLAYASALGIEGQDAEALASLRAVDPERLLATPGGSETYIDGWLLPDSPYSLLENGRHNNIPVIVGGLAQEQHGLAQLAPEITMEQLDGQLQASFGDAAERVKALHRNAIAISPLEAQKEISTNNGFLSAARLWGRLVAERGNNAYVYYFSRKPPVFRLYTPDRPDLNGDGGGRTLGAYHSGELAYVFDNLDVVGIGWDDTDRALSETMADYWVNFAKTGDPNGPGLPQWPAYDPAADVVQILDATVAAQVHPRTAELKLLEEIYLQQRQGEE